MSLTEQKSNLGWLKEITDSISKRYANRYFGVYFCFVSSNGTPFKPFAYPGRDALGLEYANTQEDAAAGLFEDGDLFYMEDYANPDDMLRDMVKEIDG